MAVDLLEIANSAITKIGGATIMSINDQTVEGNACRLRMDACRRIVLRMHPWNCAIERKTLAPDTTAPVYEYSAAFPLPTGCLRLLEVADDMPYRLEGRNILANTDALDIKYIDNLTDPSKIDELLGEAIACYLAWDIAYKVTQKTTVQEGIWKQLQLILRQAKSVDAQEERDYEVQADVLLESRVGQVSPGRSNR